MVDDLELMFPSLDILKPFNRLILELDNLSAANAHKMVVVFSSLRALIKFFSLAKILFFQDIAIL